MSVATISFSAFICLYFLMFCTDDFRVTPQKSGFRPLKVRMRVQVADLEPVAESGAEGEEKRIVKGYLLGQKDGVVGNAK